MKQEISKPMLVAAIVVVVLLVGFIGWKVFGPRSDALDAETIKQHMAMKERKEGK